LVNRTDNTTARKAHTYSTRRECGRSVRINVRGRRRRRRRRRKWELKKIERFTL
jgi:hypothetical protein